MQAKETEVIALKGEYGGLNSKVDHLHKELRNSRENITALHEKNAKIMREKKLLQSDVDLLNETLENKDAMVKFCIN